MSIDKIHEQLYLIERLYAEKYEDRPLPFSGMGAYDKWQAKHEPAIQEALKELSKLVNEHTKNT